MRVISTSAERRMLPGLTSQMKFAEQNNQFLFS